jgi:molybdopterin-guanine dinucleotide biosynthesis protein A
MGRDKSLIVYHDVPQRDYLFGLLARHCAKVFTSCRQDQQVPPGLNPVFDCFDIPGPLNGILSAFEKEETSWLVVAVDMPFVDDNVLESIVSNRDKTKLATCFYNPETQLPEPLLTLWEKDAHVFLKKFAAAGNISPREFLRTHPVSMIQPPDPKALVNINYPNTL